MSKDSKESSLTTSEQERAHNAGQWDGSRGSAPSSHSPWHTPFESDKHYEDRRDAYADGHRNGTENQKK